MRRITGILVLVLLAGLLRATRTRPDPAGPAPAAPPASTEAPPRALPALLTLPSTVCDASAYLCSGLAESPEPRVVRWPDVTEVIRIRVPVPAGVEPSRARELQRQAAAGIREWQGRPLPLRIESDEGAPVDFTVRWERELSDDRLGLTTVRWRIGAAGPELRVDAFVLATHGADGRALDPGRVRLTAAHEMGHALGLPHSDDRADLMYPYNTSTRLTARDFRAMEVLYDLPSGAPLVLPPPR